MTLQSVHVGTPSQEISSPGIDNEKTEVVSFPEEQGLDEKERPVVERFVTAQLGDLKVGSVENEKDKEKEERPGVERFETAQEDLSTLANGKA